MLSVSRGPMPGPAASGDAPARRPDREEGDAMSSPAQPGLRCEPLERRTRTALIDPPFRRGYRRPFAAVRSSSAIPSRSPAARRLPPASPRSTRSDVAVQQSVRTRHHLSGRHPAGRPPWYTQLFTELPNALWRAAVPPDATSAEVDFLERMARRAAGSVLDVPCGSGRHALELARRGHRVCGVDVSVEAIDCRAGSRGGAACDRPRVVDMAQLDLREAVIGRRVRSRGLPGQRVRLPASTTTPSTSSPRVRGLSAPAAPS